MSTLYTTIVQCTRCLAEIPANVDDEAMTYEDAGCPNGCDVDLNLFGTAPLCYEEDQEILWSEDN